MLDVLSDGDKYRKIIEEITRDTIRLEEEERSKEEERKKTGVDCGRISSYILVALGGENQHQHGITPPWPNLLDASRQT